MCFVTQKSVTENTPQEHDTIVSHTLNDDETLSTSPENVQINEIELHFNRTNPDNTHTQVNTFMGFRAFFILFVYFYLLARVRVLTDIMY